MAFTHDDVYKPLPGYKVLVSHFHFHFNEQLTDAGTHGSAAHMAVGVPRSRHQHGNPGGLPRRFPSERHRAIRLNEQKVYFEGCERFSDRDLLLIPGEEPDANFGGHYMFVFPKPLFFTHVKQPAKGPRASHFRRLWRRTARCITPPLRLMNWIC